MSDDNAGTMPDQPTKWLPNSSPAVRQRLRRRLDGGFRGPALGTILCVLTIGCWHAAVVLSDLPTVVLPAPAEVGVALIDLRWILAGDAAVTALTAGLGLTVGLVIGTVLAFFMAISRSAAAVILPYVVALRIAPLVAIAPLLFLWFGRGVPGKALLVTTITVFPITIASLDGLRSTPESYLTLLRSVGASTSMVFLHVRLPAAAPSVFAGIKNASTLAVIGAVVAEFVTLDAGIGYRVFETSTSLQTANSYAALAVLSGLGLLFYGIPSLLERAVRTRFN